MKLVIYLSSAYIIEKRQKKSYNIEAAYIQLWHDIVRLKKSVKTNILETQALYPY